MDAIDDISSTCENDSISRNDKSSVMHTPGKTYDCESETDYDSENETIDVICDNSGETQFGDKMSEVNNPYNILNRDFFDAKSYNCQKNFVSGPSHSNTKNSVINSKSKTFLIDNILGNNKSCSNQASSVENNDESDTFEETADEHNGIYIKLYLKLHTSSEHNTSFFSSLYGFRRY